MHKMSRQKVKNYFSQSSQSKLECYISTSELLRPKKRAKKELLTAVSIAHLKITKDKKKEVEKLKVLFDSGCSATLINKKAVRKLQKKQSNKVSWSTKAGTLTTNRTCKIKFSLPEFYPNKEINWKAYVDESSKNDCTYDMIIGRDLMHEIGIDILFSTAQLCWDNATIPMKPYKMVTEKTTEEMEEEILFSSDPNTIGAERIQEIIDAKYSEANLDKVVESCTEIDKDQKEKLLKLLKKYDTLFDGSLGSWKTDPIDLELKEPDTKPYHAKPYPVPYSQERKLKEEIQRLIDYGVLRKINNSEWASPMFTISKPDGTLRSLADLRELNKRIKRKPYPLPKISDLLQKLEGFLWATSLDLNMGYYHIVLTPNSSRLCTVVLPWGKYEYLRLPMGLCNSPDIFQEKMGDLMQDLEMVRAYLDDLLIISKQSFEEHLEHLEKVFTRLLEAGLKINASKSHFCQTSLEYLGYLISRQGIQPSTKKVEAILKIKAPKTRRQLRRFIGMVNYYRDMWPHRSDILAPLTSLTSKAKRWKWTEECQKAFEAMKKLIAQETLLAFPDFSKPFEIHTDASKVQLGACISQEGKPIAFYSRKLNPAQTRYTTTERELLSIVETLKEFRNILLGQELVVYTDHENLTYKQFNSDRVMRWRLYIEEYSPQLKYIKGEHNIVADALSRMEIDSTPMDNSLEAYYSIFENFGKEDEDAFDNNPLTYANLQKAQNEDSAILKILAMEKT